MRNFQQARGWKNIVQSKPFLILFGIVILIFSWNVFGLWNKMQETVKNKKIVEDKVALLKQQKENISSEINSLNTVEGKEKFFREIDKAKLLRAISELLNDIPYEQLKIPEDELFERIRGILVLEAVSGILNELTPEQMKGFDEAVKRRPLFK